MEAERIDEAGRTAQALSQRAVRATKWSQGVRAVSAELLARSRAAAATRLDVREGSTRPEAAVEELWLAYIAAGGACSVEAVDRHLVGGTVLPPLEVAILEYAAHEIVRERELH